MYDDCKTIKAILMKLNYTKDIQVSIEGEEKGNQQVLITLYNQTKQNDLVIKDKQNKNWVDIKTIRQMSNNILHMPISNDRLTVYSNSS